MRIGLVTSAELPQLDADDQILYHALLERQIDVERVVWTDPAVDWSQYSLCVIRSTWDYHYQIEAYLNWAERVSRLTNLWNPVDVLRWNAHKSYLSRFEDAGIRIISTAFFAVNAQLTERDFTSENTDWVAKPAVSASARDTFKMTPDNLNETLPRLNELLKRQEMLVQPFINTLHDQGERSLIYIDNQFSHAVIKYPHTDDFRVQVHSGGRIQPYKPMEAELVFAEQTMAFVNTKLLYARVDIVTDNAGQICLSEIELIEPSLYLAFGPETVNRLIESLIQKTESSKTIR